VNVNASTTMGTISSELPLSSQRSLTGGSLQGALNGGGPTLKLATSMGNIRISKP
jgi:hypothetical protein